MSVSISLHGSAVAADVAVTVTRSSPLVNTMDLGCVLEHMSMNAWDDSASLARARALLGASVNRAAQMIYGWGMDNPEVSSGVYTWTTMDSRVNQMLLSGVTPIINLCGAPDWMTSQGTNTSNFNLQYSPTPAHYADFAELARQFALRYSAPSNPTPVLYYQVWSEMRGSFWDGANNTWDMAAYCTMYNLVYAALKGVNSAIQVGGPYLPMEGDGAAQDIGATSTVFTASPLTARNSASFAYFYAHATGYDFVSYDRGVVDYNDTQQSGYTDAQLFQLVHWHGSVVSQLKAISGYNGAPIWCSEGFGWASNTTDVQVASEAACLRSGILAGAGLFMKWQDGGYWNDSRGNVQRGLYTSTDSAGGGTAYPVQVTYQTFKEQFPVGASVYTPVSSDATKVEALSNATQTVLINKRNVTTTVSVNGAAAVSLSPYQVLAVTG